jgi:hypothetical protein
LTDRLLSIAGVGAASAAAMIALAGSGAGTALAPSAAAKSSGVMIPTPSQERLSGGTVDSSNWSGYVVTSAQHRITAVSGSFVVPSARRRPGGFAATWAGIGGYRTSALIQAGVGEQTSRAVSGRHYYAWFELLPRPEHPIPGHPVRPGEHIEITISKAGSARWRLSIVDVHHWRWTRRVTYHSSNASAEWILEAPMLDGSITSLAHVGIVHFGPGDAFRLGGQRQTVGQGHPTRILLVGGNGRREATPSPLASQGRFNDCAYSRRCRAP